MDYGQYVSVFRLLEVKGEGGGVMRRHFRGGSFKAETSGASFDRGFPFKIIPIPGKGFLNVGG
jgi:hypothetical protein